MTTLQNVTCDNCSASYSIDFSKLKREKNRITCRRCQHKIVFYKSQILEPQNEAAVVDHADEKTLVEDDRKPNVQQTFQKDPETLVSKNTPPLIGADPLTTKEVSDPTIRRSSPLPIEDKPQVDVRKPSAYEDIEKNLASSKPTAKSRRNADPLGLRGTLQLCTGMMVLGLVSILGMQFSSGTIVDMAFVVGASSLTMGALWLTTSDFGFSKPNVGISVGGASIVAVISGVLIFGGGESIEEVPVIEEATEVLPTVDVATVDKGDNVEQEASFDRSQSNKTKSTDGNRSMGVTTATVRDAEKSNQAHKEMFAAANQYIQSKESSKPKTQAPAASDNIEDDVDEASSRPSDLEAPTEPNDLLDDDLDLDGFDDLGLDEEEEKKGLFGRKEKSEEPKPGKKPAAKPKSDINVDIPTNVLDIIIRNNKDVKGCYGQVRAETGTFPKSIDVMFTLQPTGKVSSAYIASGPYVGSKFEGCMRAAFKGMTFPTFDQAASPQTLKYNLKL